MNGLTAELAAFTANPRFPDLPPRAVEIVVRQVLATHRLTDGAHPALSPKSEEESKWNT